MDKQSAIDDGERNKSRREGREMPMKREQTGRSRRWKRSGKVELCRAKGGRGEKPALACFWRHGRAYFFFPFSCSTDYVDLKLPPVTWDTHRSDGSRLFIRSFSEMPSVAEVGFSFFPVVLFNALVFCSLPWGFLKNVYPTKLYCVLYSVRARRKRLYFDSKRAPGLRTLSSMRPLR